MNDPMDDFDLLLCVAKVLADSPHPLSIQDNRYSHRAPIPTDLIGMICTSPPAYRVLVVVNWQPGYCKGGPWVSVTHTERFGFTPRLEGYTFLEPPDGVDRDDPEAVKTWIGPVLLEAVERHAPFAAKAKTDDAGTPGPTEAWDAVERLDPQGGEQR